MGGATFRYRGLGEKMGACLCARVNRADRRSLKVTDLARKTWSPLGELPRTAGALDIIIPAHNEEHRIGPTLDAYRRGFPGSDVRFLVALDLCQDETADVVARHVEVDPRVELYSYPKLGKGGVIRRAFGHCRGDLIAFVDADGSTEPGELARLVAMTRDADGAIASRHLPDSSIHGRRGLVRATASAVFAWIVRGLFGLPFRDTQCGAKVIRRQALERLLVGVTIHDLLFDLDLLLQAHILGLDIVEVPSVWVARSGSQVRLARDLVQVTKSLFRLWWAGGGGAGIGHGRGSRWGPVCDPKSF